ncbi:hypothetical protein Mapa_007010 [Marchantia paleacea]|nr:hypothetical protein Mapa_007010 [Marchantia paleacea]
MIRYLQNCTPIFLCKSISYEKITLLIRHMRVITDELSPCHQASVGVAAAWLSRCLRFLKQARPKQQARSIPSPASDATMGTTIFVVLLLSDGEGTGSGPGLEEFVPVPDPGPEDGVGGKGEFGEFDDGLPGGGRITDDGPGDAAGVEFEGGLEPGEPPGLDDDGGEPDGDDEGEFGPGGGPEGEADGLGVEGGANGDGGVVERGAGPDAGVVEEEGDRD